MRNICRRRCGGLTSGWEKRERPAHGDFSRVKKLRTNGCPVPKCGNGRYKFKSKFKGKFKDKFNYARLKSRRPLQIQQQRQRRPAKAGRYNVNIAKSTSSRLGYFCWLADCSWSVSDLCQLESGSNFFMALTIDSVSLPRSFS